MARAEGEVRRVTGVLLERIVAGRYPAGLRLPSEADVATELSCGRSTVREALRSLTDLGVVRSRRGSGAMVLDFRREGTPALLPAYLRAGRFDQPVSVLAEELLHLRRMLALEAVRVAARYAEPGTLAAARAVLDHARAVEGDPIEHAQLELSLFRALVCASRVWPAVWLANAFWAPMQELSALLAPLVGAPPRDFQPAMRRLVDLIEAGDAEAAEAHLVRWLDGVDRELSRHLSHALAPSDRERGSAAVGSPRSTGRAGEGRRRR
jgi:GntR family transcriptional repressor for pyruvate dehydrogenase complex